MNSSLPLVFLYTFFTLELLNSEAAFIPLNNLTNQYVEGFGDFDWTQSKGGHPRDPRKASACTLVLDEDLNSKDAPLVLTEDLGIVRPEVKGEKTGVINVSGKNAHLLLACTGPNNVQTVSNKQTASLECKSGHLRIEGENFDKDSEIDCADHFAKSQLQKTDKKCGDSGIILEIGFKVQGSWLPQIELCYDTNAMTTLYAKHKIYGGSIDASIKYKGRPKFSMGDPSVFEDLNLDKLYTKKSQEDQLPGYIEKNKYLARGHLAPDADFVYVTEQMMTYYYANVVPQWQPFNDGNWVKVEKTFRELASQVQATLEVYTGTFGILKLPLQGNKKKEIFLEPDMKVIPVPEIMWKIGREPETNQCIVAVGHNDIYLEKEPKEVCNPITSKGWEILSDVTHGYTYYCSYDDFYEAISTAPKIKCSEVFTFTT